jgi:hypothetical protein
MKVRFRLIAITALALVCAACAGKPFNVKVVPRVEPDAISAPSVAGPLSVRAKAEWDEDWAIETFDANVLLAGVLPVRADIENVGHAPIAADKLDVTATDASGRTYARLDATKARKAIERYYGIGVRSKTGDKLYKQDFAANALDLKTALAPGEHRQGFLFLKLPPDVNGRVPVRLLVVAKREGARVEVPLD